MIVILDIFINHELVTTKSSDSDYFISELVFLRDTYNEEYLRTAMSVAGIFSDKNRDLDEFTNEDGDLTPGGKAHILDRRENAEKIIRDGVTYYRYTLMASINHGLARQEKPLPSGKFSVYFCSFYYINYKSNFFLIDLNI